MVWSRVFLQQLGCGGELLDCSVVVLCGQGLQGAPAVSVQLDDLHEERAGERGFRRAQHLVPNSSQQLRHHLRELFLQEQPGALQLH